MGQKVNPIGFRVSVNHDWRSRWFADKRSFGDFLAEDCMIRDYIKDKARSAALASIQIERAANRVRIQILTARPGVLMSAKAKDDKTLLLDEMKQYLLKKTGKKIFFQIDEIRDQDANAQLIAENIADQLVRRVTLKRAMKRAQKTAMDLGVDGIKMLACGRIGGAELSAHAPRPHRIRLCRSQDDGRSDRRQGLGLQVRTLSASHAETEEQPCR